MTSIEINGTFHGLQKPEVFAKWHDATPEAFRFSVKAPRFIVQRKDLASAGTALDRFMSSGLTELKSKPGLILWQLNPTKTFDAFLTLLPAVMDGCSVRHVLEVRHPSFMNAEFLAIVRQHGTAVVYEDESRTTAS